MTAQIFGLVPKAAPADAQWRHTPLLGEVLAVDFGIDPDDIAWALERQRRGGRPLGQILIAHGLVSETDIFTALATQHDTIRIEVSQVRVNPAQIDALGLETCTKERVVPLGSAGAVTRIATSQPQTFADQKPWLTAALGPVAMVVVSDSDLNDLLFSHRKHALITRAETRVPIVESCRTFAQSNLPVGPVFGALGCLAIASMWPVLAFTLLAFIALAVLTVNAILWGSAAWLGRHPRPDPVDPPILARLPTITLMVPLHKERDIAQALFSRLERLDYPRELLDICLVVEAGDDVTRRAIADAHLPPWIRSFALAKGEVMTKPRAMNYALDFSRGSIIGIYDAEDAPAPDQLMAVARQFANSPPNVATIQGRLNFYNPKASWITRCFCIDYASWFSLILPVLRRFDWPIPLGGTTVFMRRDVLEDIGAWDSHNVTEDADLGIRLARRGYRTELLDSTTMEEATGTPRAWIKQRSRWLKGYAITYAVHMRHPRALLNDLGWWRFLGFQTLFLGVLISVALAPVLWSFWLLALGLPHPWAGQLSLLSGAALTFYLFGANVVFMAANVVGLRRIGRKSLIWSVPLMHAYFPLATISLVKALVEVVLCPFFWDKTSHGVSDPDSNKAMSDQPALHHA